MHTRLAIHDVAELEVTAVNAHTSSDGKKRFYCRDIVVKDENGNTITLSLYSDTSDRIALTV